MLSLHRLRAFWRTTSALDRLAAAVVILCILAWTTLLGGFTVNHNGWLVALFIIALGYLVVRLARWVRRRLLWGLRNRLIVAYIFIAVVPVVLLLAMAAISADLLYFQLGAHLLQDSLKNRISEAGNVAHTLEETIQVEQSLGRPVDLQKILAHPSVAGMISSAQRNLPGLTVELHPAAVAIGATARPVRSFSGLVQSGGKLWIEAVVPSATTEGGTVQEGELFVRAPVNSAFLANVARDLGPVQLTTCRVATSADPLAGTFSLNGRRLVRTGQVMNLRPLQPRRAWYDFSVSGGATLDAVLLDGDQPTDTHMPVVAAFSLRPVELNGRLFASLGLLGSSLAILLTLTGIIFLIVWVAALVTGIVLTRTITTTVGDLYEATRHVRQGDFRHRIHVRQRDQLGVLGESFNAMTGSIAELIEEQRKRQRLENEISIAREVQSQLFPRELPSLPGLELAAICRAARVVSGDYYDFVKLGDSQLGMAVADISGKGISAALLMASLQAALRGQAILDGHRSTADVVATLNRHLFLNTSDDRYATLFYAEYDAATRALRYTNAGHCAPFFVCDGHVQKLDQGGTVVGLFDHAKYSQSTIQVNQDSLLVAFSDGLLEPENVYGEEFGNSRIAAEILRLRDGSAQSIAEGLLSAVEQWAGTAEQADDMTVVVARFR